MPIELTVDHERRTIFTTASGVLTRNLLSEYLRGKVQQGIIDYAELFDARNVTLDFMLSDLRQINDDVSEALGSRKPRKIAAVTNSRFVYSFGLAYAALVKSSDVRFRLFEDIQEAKNWLLSPVDDTDPG
jgi:hypothetical protein